MKQRIKKIWNFVNGVLIGLIILLAVALVGVRPFGVELYVVLSGSMEPVYPTGSVIYVTETDIDALKVRDVITFRIGEDTTATHRIIEVLEVEGEKAFRTQGDANDVEDGSPILASQVIGSPIFMIPYLGYLVAYMQSTSGHYAMIAVAAFLLLMICLPDMILGEDQIDKKKLEEKTLEEKASGEKASGDEQSEEGVSEEKTSDEEKMGKEQSE